MLDKEVISVINDHYIMPAPQAADNQMSKTDS